MNSQPETPDAVIARLQEQVMRQADIIVEQSETIDRQGGRILALTIADGGQLDIERLKDTIRVLWESRRLWQDRILQVQEDLTEAEWQIKCRDALLENHTVDYPALDRRILNLAKRVKENAIRSERRLADYRRQLEQHRRSAESIDRVLALADEWERGAGPSSSAEDVYGKQVVSVEFAVREIRRAAYGPEHQPESD